MKESNQHKSSSNSGLLRALVLITRTEENLLCTNKLFKAIPVSSRLLHLVKDTYALFAPTKTPVLCYQGYLLPHGH